MLLNSDSPSLQLAAQLTISIFFLSGMSLGISSGRINSISGVLLYIVTMLGRNTRGAFVPLFWPLQKITEHLQEKDILKQKVMENLM